MEIKGRERVQSRRRNAPPLSHLNKGSSLNDKSASGSKSTVSRKKAVAVVMAILVLNVISSAAAESDNDMDSVQGSDYGIFSAMSSLNAEQLTREDDPAVLEEVDEAFSTIAPGEHFFKDPGSAGFIEEEISIPEPLLNSPVVFDAVSKNPIIDDTSIIDWVLPPPLSDQGLLNYLVLTDSDGYQTWSLGSMVPRIGITVDSSLDKWVYVDVDGQVDTGDPEGNDIRARLTFGRDLLERDWDVSLFPPTLSFNNAGMRIEVEAIETQNGMASTGGSVYFIKGISFEDKNYIWSIGIGLENFMDSLTMRISARQWRAGPDTGLISQFLSSGSINFNDLNLLEILGPYTVSYDFRTAPENLDVYLSILRVFDQNVEDRAYVKLGIGNDQFHDRIIPRGSLSLNVDKFGDPIDRLEWRAGQNGSNVDDTIDLKIRYAEFSDDLVDANIHIPILPSYLKIDIEYLEEDGNNRTKLDLRSRNGIAVLEFLEVIYTDWEGGSSLDNWMATKVQLKGIPKEIHLETTAGVPLEKQDTSLLNLFDSFMSQLAGRFYRIGKIFREIPRAVAEMPSRKGSSLLDCKGNSILSIDYIYTTGPYLNNTGNFAAFLDHGSTMPAISAHLEGLSYYRGSFDNGNDITLTLDDVPGISILASSPEGEALVRINEIPRTIRLKMEGENVIYEGSKDGEPAEIGSVSYIYRDPELFFDVVIYDIPSSLNLLRSSDGISIESGTGAIGTVEVFTGNSTTVMPIDLPERNFVSLKKENEEVGVGMRLSNFKSIVYNNGTNGFLELSTVTSSNFYVVIDDRDSELDIDAVFSPLPPFTHIDTPSVIAAPELGIPDILDIESISDYSEILLALSQIGRAPLVLASGISEGLTDTIGQYSSGLSMSWDLSDSESNLDLFIIIDKKGDTEIDPAKWTHGIWLEQSGLGDNSSLSGKIYLQGMPTKGDVTLSFSELTISVDMDFFNYNPGYNWMLVKTSGVQDRDISIYLTGLENGMDFQLSMEITTDLSIGGLMEVKMDVDLKDEFGSPLDLGPMIATLRKASPILSVRQMYLPEIPSVMHLDAYLGEGVTAEYSASKSIDHLYFKITKLLSDRWSQVYAIFHDLPTSFDITLTPNTDFSIQEPFPLQGLPSLDISTSSSDMDIFIEYDGSGFGQRGRYKIYADNLGNTSTYYDGGDYVIDSDGIGYLSLELERLPAMESFTLTSLVILSNDLKHLKLSVAMGYGIYPIISISDAQGGSFQIKMDAEVENGGDIYDPDLFFLNFRTTNILGFDLITGVSINKDNSAVDMDRSDGSVIMPAPILTFWGFVIGEVI